jgi:DNA-binding NtrC family response regulator
MLLEADARCILNDKEISILLVDDDRETTRMLSTLLRSCIDAQLACIAAGSADEAIDLLDSSFFHVVLTDVQMPGRSGLELCEHIGVNHPNTVPIVHSAMTDIRYAIAAMRAGAFDYLLKPIPAAELKYSVGRALAYQQALMARHYCEQSLEEEVRDLLLLNARLREARRQAARSPDIARATSCWT